MAEQNRIIEEKGLFGLQHAVLLCENACCGMAIAEEDGTITFVNGQAEALLKQDSDETEIKSQKICGGSLFFLKRGGHNLLCRTLIEFKEKNKNMKVLMMVEEQELQTESINELTFVKNERKHFQDILDCIYDEIYVLDNQANILMINETVKKKDCTREVSVGSNMKELVAAGFCDTSLSIKVLESKRPMGCIFKDVKSGDILSWGIPHFENNEIDFVVCTEWDLNNLLYMHNLLSEKEEPSGRAEVSSYSIKSQSADEIVGSGYNMKKLLQLAGQVARTDETVLIQGESGTGKELIMKYIYNNSQRASGPLVEINCGAIPENLIESELFGYEKGAFTSANAKGKVGLLEAARRGTVFLDEIGEIPFSAQAKLLRALQEREIYRVGGIMPLPIDVRIIAATNQNLQKAVEEKSFREDLYYRLNVLPIHMPALRERKEDIPALIEYFLRKFNMKYKKEKRIDPSDYDLFQNYAWPGNVRELKNLIERVLIITHESVIPRAVWLFHLNTSGNYMQNSEGENKIDLKQMVEDYEKNLIISFYNKYDNSRQFAAMLGTDKSTINRKLTKYNIRK